MSRYGEGEEERRAEGGRERDRGGRRDYQLNS